MSAIFDERVSYFYNAIKFRETAKSLLKTTFFFDPKKSKPLVQGFRTPLVQGFRTCPQKVEKVGFLHFPLVSTDTRYIYSFNDNIYLIVKKCVFFSTNDFSVPTPLDTVLHGERYGKKVSNSSKQCYDIWKNYHIF